MNLINNLNRELTQLKTVYIEEEKVNSIEIDIFKMRRVLVNLCNIINAVTKKS